MYTKRQRTLASVACMVLVFVVSFSLFFAAKEVDHDCTGENCPICACVHQAEKTLRQLKTGMIGVPVILPSAEISILALSCAFLLVSHASLIIQKVRLND